MGGGLRQVYGEAPEDLREPDHIPSYACFDDNDREFAKTENVELILWPNTVELAAQAGDAEIKFFAHHEDWKIGNTIPAGRFGLVVRRLPRLSGIPSLLSN